MTGGCEDPIVDNLCPKYSPLYHLRTCFRTLRIFCGFPLVICDKDVSVFKFRHLDIWRCLFLPTLIIVGSITLQIYLIGPKSDASSILIVFIPRFAPNYLAMIIIMILYSKKSKEISQMCQSITTYKSDCCVPDCYSINSIYNMRWTFYIGIVASLMALNSSLFVMQTLQGSSGISNLYLAIVCTMNFFTNLAVTLPLVIVSTNLITIQLLESLKTLIHKYNGELAYFTQNQQFMYKHLMKDQIHDETRDVTTTINMLMNRELNIPETFLSREEHLVNKGFLWWTLKDMVEQIWGDFIGIEWILSLFGLTIEIVSSVVYLSRHLSFTIILASLFAAIHYLMRLCLVCHSGDKIKRNCYMVERNLEVILVNNSQIRSLSNHTRLKLLMKKISPLISDIRPWQAFSINKLSVFIGLSIIFIGVIISLFSFYSQMKFTIK